MKPLPPVALAVIVPSDAPGAEGFAVVAVTLTVTPEQGLGLPPPPPPPPLLQAIKITGKENRSLNKSRGK